MLGIYCRISKKKKEEDVSIETQTEAGIAFAKKNGFSYRVFVDKGISGTGEIKARPSFAELFDALDKKQITAVYCYDQSRIERNTNVWLLFIAAIVKNNYSYYEFGKLVQLDDPQTKLVTSIISLTNEMYAALTGKKVKDALMINAMKGKTHGLVAYGYRKSKEGYFEIVPEEEEIIKKIYKLSLKGNGAYTIAKILNKDRVPTKFHQFEGEIIRHDNYTGKKQTFAKKEVKWRGNVIYDMIKNPIYKGLRKWQNEFVEVPSIVNTDTWERVNNNLQKNKKFIGKKAEYRYLLNGLLRCGNCGGVCRGKFRLKANDNAYKCANKFTDEKCRKSRSISIPKLDTLIYKLLILDRSFNKVLKTFPVKEDSNKVFWNSKLEETNSLLSKANKRAERFYNLLQNVDLKVDAKVIDGYSVAQNQVRQLQSQIESIQSKILELEADLKNVAKPKKSDFENMPEFESLKNFIHSVIDSITIFHNKKERGGEFLLIVRFKAYDGAFNLTSNWKASEWEYIIPVKKKITIKDEELIQFN